LLRAFFIYINGGCMKGTGKTTAIKQNGAGKKKIKSLA
jgi:hypothetical protein